MAIPWDLIKTEYITDSSASYRKLAKKYDVTYSVIGEKARAEGWVEQREQYRDKTVTETIDAISQQQVDRAARFQTVADKLLGKIEAIVDQEGVLDTKSLRALSAAMKDLKEIQGVKSDLDKQEQEARIANLRKQAEKEDSNDAPALVIEGLPEEFKA